MSKRTLEGTNLKKNRTSGFRARMQKPTGRNVIKSSDPAQDPKVNFLNYPVYVGANRGRGQIY